MLGGRRGENIPAATTPPLTKWLRMPPGVKNPTAMVELESESDVVQTLLNKLQHTSDRDKPYLT